MHPFDLKQSSAETKIPALRKSLNRWLTGTEKKKDIASAKFLYLRESDFLKEETFREVVFFERKRAERSRKKVSLMLLDLSGLRDSVLKCSIARHLAQALTDRTDISFNGWYKQDIIGALFTGKTETEKEDLRKKIFTALPPAAAEQAHCLKIAFCSFSASNNGHADAEETIPVFYPDRKNGETGRRMSLFIKRAMDIVGGVAALFLFSPFFIALPLVIKATSKGPVLFKQERIGRNGVKFVFLKFRTMSLGNDPKIHREYIKNFIREKKSYDAGRGGDNGPVYKIKDDPRITPIGRFLRKTSLDELPQFFNVLKGEMSLVGPRPPIPYELDNYELWHLRRVMEIKPGITGLWQVKGRSSTTFDEMVRLDLKYSKEWSLWLDIKILLKTPWVVIAGKGAY